MIRKKTVLNAQQYGLIDVFLCTSDFVTLQRFSRFAPILYFEEKVTNGITDFLVCYVKDFRNYSIQSNRTDLIIIWCNNVSIHNFWHIYALSWVIHGRLYDFYLIRWYFLLYRAKLDRYITICAAQCRQLLSPNGTYLTPRPPPRRSRLRLRHLNFIIRRIINITYTFRNNALNTLLTVKLDRNRT